MNIVEFYKDKTIFLSGTTGFVGKVVLEKLMRTLPHFKKIYVMVRKKKTITIQQRLENEIFSSEIFSVVQDANPELF